jgi:uncharacterized lipoprotein YddW (UPF0748 family)
MNFLLLINKNIVNPGVKMKTKYLLLILCVLLTGAAIQAQTTNPKREMRGIWMASLGIDWPTNVGTSASTIAQQKNQFVAILDQHKVSGMNAIFFHVRPQCDAVYKSSIEPWSSYLTGRQGTAPSDTNYDPLTFAIQESHKRGVELHAWLNPYRVVLSGGSVSSLAANNVVNLHPDWIIKCSGSEYRFLNPGLPEVRAYVVKVIMDIVRRYDVDGIHFDDYFYPYSDYGTFTDNTTFSAHPNGFTDVTAWRKNNVHLLLTEINDSIKAVKPWIKFGISPSGNNSVNAGIYVDCSSWLAGTYTDTTGKAVKGAPYIDYILPQLYWVGFSGLLPSWSGDSFLNGRHLYIGQAAYRYSEGTFPANELSTEVQLSRGNVNSSGGVYFSSQSIINNLASCRDSLRHNYYSNYSLTPKMSWLPGAATKPNAPTNFKCVLNTTNNKYEFTWDKPAKASDGDTAFSYVVYRFDTHPSSLDNGNNILGTTGDVTLSNSYAKYSSTKGNYYVVTCIDRYGNESAMSTVYKFDTTNIAPTKPMLALPANGDSSQGVNATLKWRKSSNTESYALQISTSPTFLSGTIVYLVELQDTTYTFKGLSSGLNYYWRVAANSIGGTANSDTYCFKAGFPTAPVLATPAHASTNVSLNPIFKWYKQSIAASYEFWLSTSSTFSPATSTVLDTTINDTSLGIYTKLATNKTHYWKVRAINSLGASDWSSSFGFRTTSSTDVEDVNASPKSYQLNQNYPNPFNPTTTITYVIPKSGFVSVKVYDVLGNEVETLVNGVKSAGTYSIQFPMQNKQLPSGVYFYKMSVDNFISIKKMILIK